MDKEQIVELKELARGDEKSCGEAGMSRYGNQYLYEIRQRAVNVYQDFLGRDFDDQHIGINHIRYEACHKDKFLKIHAINKQQLRGLGYFLYTFTPEKVISLIDDVLKADKTIEALNERIVELEKEADWLAMRLEERDIADYYERRIELQEMRDEVDWREAARKAVEEQCKSN